jgi:GNAT superfamily N-acetyltransferase
MHAATVPKPVDINHSWTTQTGQLVRIRPISQHDVDRVAAYLDGLSVGTRYFRFGRWDTQFSRDDLIRICNPNPAECCRLITVTEQEGVEVQIASAAFVVGNGRESGELSILVSDQWQGTRVAHRLMSHLIERAAGFGLNRMFAKVLGTNHRMIRFAQRHGFKFAHDTDHAPIKTLVLVLR